MSLRLNGIVFPALLAGVLAVASSSANAAVDRVGNPLTLSGANFSIFAFQDIDSSSPLGTIVPGKTMVNRNFEFPNSIGVTYSLNNKQTDFGIGLYQGTAKATESTGLEVLYNQPVFAGSATATVEDFDIKSGDKFFKPEKVEPSITFLGPGNSPITGGTASPAQIFANLVPVASKGEPDVWTINFPGLLNTLHLTDTTPINGFLLFADTTAGEKPSSDPYLLVAVGNAAPVPESSTYLLVIVVGISAVLFHSRRRLLKTKAA
jgi:hypothetical protein